MEDLRGKIQKSEVKKRKIKALCGQITKLNIKKGNVK